MAFKQKKLEQVKTIQNDLNIKQNDGFFETFNTNN